MQFLVPTIISCLIGIYAIDNVVGASRLVGCRDDELLIYGAVSLCAGLAAFVATARCRLRNAVLRHICNASILFSYIYLVAVVLFIHSFVERTVSGGSDQHQILCDDTTLVGSYVHAIVFLTAFIVALFATFLNDAFDEPQSTRFRVVIDHLMATTTTTHRTTEMGTPSVETLVTVDNERNATI